MRTSFIVIIALLLTIMACKSNKEQAFNKIEAQFKDCLKTLNKPTDNLKSVYMIIPRAGCSGCISNAESFMLSCIEDSAIYKDRIRFVLTDFDSEKTLRARFGNLFSNEMIIVDRDNLFKANESLKSIYPTILFFDAQSKLVQVSESSPSKDGIGDIKALITTAN